MESVSEMQTPSGAHVWLVLMKAYQAIAAAAAEDLSESHLGESDFRVLEVLLHKGALAVNVIGPKVNLTPGSISTAVDRLHERGLVSRCEDLADRRVRMVDLTPQGRHLIEAVYEKHAAKLEKIADVLSHEERLQLEHLLKKIGYSGNAQKQIESRTII
jgi:MarR family 2-MHQ and catechol resistance regulon transcriptional repressor